MLFNDFHDDISRLDEEVFLVVGLRSLRLDVEVRFLVLNPHLLDLVQVLFNGQLLLSIVDQFIDLVRVLEKVQGEQLFEIEVLSLLIEVSLHFKSDLSPMPLSHGLGLEQLKKLTSLLEQLNLRLLVIVDAPFSNVFVNFLLDSVLEVERVLSKIVEVSSVERNLLPFIP